MERAIQNIRADKKEKHELLDRLTATTNFEVQVPYEKKELTELQNSPSEVNSITPNVQQEDKDNLKPPIKNYILKNMLAVSPNLDVIN